MQTNLTVADVALALRLQFPAKPAGRQVAHLAADKPAPVESAASVVVGAYNFAEEEVEGTTARRRRNIVLIAFAGYFALLVLLVRVPPLQDQMDWVLEAKIIAHPDDPSYAGRYLVHWQPIPNLLGTVIIALFDKILPIFAAAKTAYALYLAWFIFSYTYLIRSQEKPRPLLELFGVLYALNHFFLMGFFNFVLGLSFVFFALGWLQRRKDRRGSRTWLVFSLLSLMTYLSHAVPLAVLTLTSFLWCAESYRKSGRRYLPWLLAMLPAWFCLGWYSLHRSGEFWFHYAFHNPLYYTWYQVGPWAIASNYYPLTPEAAAWINVALNALTIMTLPALAAWGLWKKRIDLRSPWVVAAALLIIIGLAAPTRLYEMLRPGQRLIFIAVLLLAAAWRPSRELGRTGYRSAVFLLAALWLWNGYWWIDAAVKTERELRVIEQNLDPAARMLLISDSHFHYREPRSYREKFADPYSYPNSINPLRYLPYAYTVEHGGYMHTLFGTGIVMVVNPDLLPSISRPWELDDPEKAGRYSHLVASGLPPNLADIAQRAARLFETIHQGPKLLIMKRKVENLTTQE